MEMDQKNEFVSFNGYMNSLTDPMNSSSNSSSIYTFSEHFGKVEHQHQHQHQHQQQQQQQQQFQMPTSQFSLSSDNLQVQDLVSNQQLHHQQLSSVDQQPHSSSSSSSPFALEMQTIGINQQSNDLMNHFQDSNSNGFQVPYMMTNTLNSLTSETTTTAAATSNTSNTSDSTITTTTTVTTKPSCGGNGNKKCSCSCRGKGKKSNAQPVEPYTAPLTLATGNIMINPDQTQTQMNVVVSSIDSNSLLNQQQLQQQQQQVAIDQANMMMMTSSTTNSLLDPDFAPHNVMQESISMNLSVPFPTDLNQGNNGLISSSSTTNSLDSMTTTQKLLEDANCPSIFSMVVGNETERASAALDNIIRSEEIRSTEHIYNMLAAPTLSMTSSSSSSNDLPINAPVTDSFYETQAIYVSNAVNTQDSTMELIHNEDVKEVEYSCIMKENCCQFMKITPSQLLELKKETFSSSSSSSPSNMINNTASLSEITPMMMDSSTSVPITTNTTTTSTGPSSFISPLVITPSKAKASNKLSSLSPPTKVKQVQDKLKVKKTKAPKSPPAEKKKNQDKFIGRSCSRCSSTSTPLWRKSPLDNQIVCNACGILLKKLIGKSTVKVSDTSSRKCSNCNTNNTPIWRRGSDKQLLCNACGLYMKHHNQNRPLIDSLCPEGGNY